MTISDLKKISPEAEAYELKPGVKYLVCFNSRDIGTVGIRQLLDIFKKENIDATVIRYNQATDSFILAEKP